jgi:hypothetical protein
VLRLWRAPAMLGDGSALWVGSAQRLVLARPFGVLALWRPQPFSTADAEPAFAALQRLPASEATSGAGVHVIRVRVPRR